MRPGVVITGKVIGAERVVQKFSGLVPAALRKNVSEEVRALGLTLERRVKLDKLEGQVLHRRSGRLVRSVNTQFSEPTPDTFTSSTGTRLVYGRAWELGFHGTVNVRGFERRTKGGAVAFVRSHTRRANMTARPFLRPTLDEMRPLIRERIQAAVRRSL